LEDVNGGGEVVFVLEGDFEGEDTAGGGHEAAEKEVDEGGKGRREREKLTISPSS
jgi:hypothetical protein